MHPIIEKPAWWRAFGERYEQMAWRDSGRSGDRCRCVCINARIQSGISRTRDRAEQSEVPKLAEPTWQGLRAQVVPEQRLHHTGRIRPPADLLTISCNQRVYFARGRRFLGRLVTALRLVVPLDCFVKLGESGGPEIVRPPPHPAYADSHPLPPREWPFIGGSFAVYAALSAASTFPSSPSK